MVVLSVVFGVLVVVAGLVWVARRNEGSHSARGNRHLHSSSGDSYWDAGGWSDGGGGGGDGGGGN
jgi:hypothetical protein